MTAAMLSIRISFVVVKQNYFGTGLDVIIAIFCTFWRQNKHFSHKPML
jgi:hypothetical protein